MNEVVYAGFWRRWVAYMIDWLIMLIPGILINLIIPYVGSLILYIIYKPVFEASSAKATPGKYLMKLKVLREDGGQLTMKQAILRYLASWLSGIILFIGYIMGAFTEKKQTLHDILLKTVVVKVQDDESINFFDLWIQELRKHISYILKDDKAPQEKNQ